MTDVAARTGGAVPRTADALLRRTLRRQRRRLVGALCLVTLWQVCEAGVPILIGVVIDRAVAQQDPRELVMWSAILCVHFTVLSFAFRFGSRLGFRAVQVESHRLRSEVSGHLLSPRGANTTLLPGEVLSIATSDADMVGAVIRQVAVSGAALAGLLVSGIALAVIDPLLAAVVLGGVPVVLACTRMVTPRLAHRSERRQESLGRATGIATDIVRGLRPLKGIGAEGVAAERYRQVSGEAANASIRAARSQGLLEGLTQFVAVGFLAAVALLAAVRALDGDLGVGGLIAVVGLAQFIGEPMALLARLVSQVTQSRASAGRVVRLLTTPPLVATGGQDRQPGADLALNGVVWGTLHGVDLDVPEGTLVAVMSEQPAANAALMTLLRGEATPDAGTVSLSGAPLTELKLSVVRERLLVADHHVDLFEGTLRTNLDPFGDCRPNHLAKAVESAASSDIVNTPTRGLDAPVAADGTTLSGGQRQRLGLARALAADPPVLVLHDPTTSVDSVTEQRIADGIRHLRHTDGASRATLILTSSPALLSVADRVVHLRDGKVVAHGRHANLLLNPSYREAVLR